MMFYIIMIIKDHIYNFDTIYPNIKIKKKPIKVELKIASLPVFLFLLDLI